MRAWLALGCFTGRMKSGGGGRMGRTRGGNRRGRGWRTGSMHR